MNHERPARREVNISFTPPASDELDRMIQITGFKEEEIMRKAFNLFRVVVHAYENGDEVVVRNDLLDRNLSRVVIPGYKKSEEYPPPK